jgi:hypothetical protein
MPQSIGYARPNAQLYHWYRVTKKWSPRQIADFYNVDYMTVVRACYEWRKSLKLRTVA